MGEFLYHYADDAGLTGILGDKSSWFTDCDYLVDRDELRSYKVPLVDAYVNVWHDLKWNFSHVGPLIYRQFDECEEHRIDCNCPFAFDYDELHRYYVFCTSRSFDDVCLWQSFAHKGSGPGYCIEIDSDVFDGIRAALQGDNIFQTRQYVLYDQETIEKLFGNKISELASVLPDIADSARECYDEYCYEALLQYANGLKCFCKQRAFALKCEHRVVLDVNSNSVIGNRVVFVARERNAAFVPRIQHGIRDCVDRVAKRVIVAPWVERTRSILSCDITSSHGDFQISPLTIRERR